MGGTARYPLNLARRIAWRLADLLTPGCERIETAGSVRRCKPEVGDIELVLIPKIEHRRVDSQEALFGRPATTPVNLAWEILDELVAKEKLPAPTKNGRRYRCHPATEHMPQLDIFAVLPPAEWGSIFAVRTGPAAFSQRCMELLRRQELRLEDGKVRRRDNSVIHCPEEADFFAACGLSWIAPEDRR